VTRASLFEPLSRLSEVEIASKEEIRELIERVKNLNAHDEERCDHHIETKMHCGLCSKAF
jgi:hypothetical protein